MPPVKSKGPIPTKPIPKGVAKPKLVNRGGSGLLNKKSSVGGKLIPADKASAQKNGKGKKEQRIIPLAKHKIVPALKALAVPIDSVLQDPLNARIHPEKNLNAIKESLKVFGQTKPIVVRRRFKNDDPDDEELPGIIVAGNGTHSCAKDLDWKEIAVSYIDMTEAEAAAYGLADNKTAELAQWDFATVAKFDKLIQDAGQVMTGWTLDELEVLRAAEWVPPKITTSSENGDTEGEIQVVKLACSSDEKNIVEVVTGLIREREGNKKLTESECINKILQEWLDNRYKGKENAGGEEESIGDAMDSEDFVATDD